jgi:hypothetical protein
MGCPQNPHDGDRMTNQTLFDACRHNLMIDPTNGKAVITDNKILSENDKGHGRIRLLVLQGIAK